MTASNKGTQNRAANQGNKFAVLNGQLEVEREMETAVGEKDPDMNQQSDPEATESEVEMEKKTLNKQGAAEKVKVAVSHPGLAKNMKGA